VYGYEYNKNTLSATNHFKYQNQERIEDFGLNIDFFKYRPSDPTIGRFWSGVDPLAEQFYYNSTYALQENKFGLGAELEGAKMVGFADLQMVYYKAKDWWNSPSSGNIVEVSLEMKYGIPIETKGEFFIANLGNPMKHVVEMEMSSGAYGLQTQRLKSKFLHLYRKYLLENMVILKNPKP
jgi:hypothetical protein